MRYYHPEQREKMTSKMHNLKFDAVLKAYFDDDRFGINAFFNYDDNADMFEVCLLGGITLNSATWEHYAHITLCDDGRWEVCSQFNGENEDELWVYAYYKRFADACRCVATGKFEKMKPIKKY